MNVDDELDIDKLKTAPVDLYQLSNVVDNNVVKKTVYNRLVTMVNAIDTNGFVLKLNITLINHVLKRKLMTPTKTYLILLGYNAKITKIESKTPYIIELVTTAVLNVVKNKIPNLSNLFKKTDYDVIEAKYFTTSDCNKFTNEILNVKINEKQLVIKSDISGFIDNSDLTLIWVGLLGVRFAVRGGEGLNYSPV